VLLNEIRELKQQNINNNKKYPAPVVETVKEAVSRRPGQAKQLLKRRHRQTATPIQSDASKAVPVTPDGATTSKKTTPWVPQSPPLT
jgi:hypothetical protein